MKIKTQFVICIVVFSLMLVVIAASVANTELQVTQINAQEQVASNIERDVSSLNTVSVDYFLYQEDLQISKWQLQLSSLKSDLESLNVTTDQQSTLVNNIKGDLERLNSLFGDVITYLQSAPRNVSVRVDPAFQIRWSSMANQSLVLASNASQLSSSLYDQAHQTNETNIWLIVSLVGTFGALLATIYLLVFRRTLKSVAELQKGINTIGLGNLDYVIDAKRQDEVSELSQSFNKMTANLKEVTASKADLEQVQGSLQESEQRWATTLASIGDAVIATDTSGKISFMNGIAENMTGWLLCEALGKTVKEVFNIVNEQSRLEVENPVAIVLEKGLIVGLANHTVLIRKDGSQVPIDDSGAPIRDKDGKTTGVVLVFRDITLRKEMEDKLEEYAKHLERIVDERTKQLQDKERLAAIGATAGMVGHDIRNPLQAITGDLYLAKTELATVPDSEEKKNTLESLQEIEKNVDYINKIVADLQDFSRPLNPHKEEADLKEIIEGLIAKNGLPENVKVTVKVESDARKVVADSTFINRIMYNLVNNAVQAMPKGGKLTIRTYKEANDTIISVMDTGVGIPEKVKGKLFTPMFTTKSKGQGFGLAVIKRMSESLGGTVTFESQEGKGTTFMIRLPNPKN
jgi:PAS domain S-box-containing protein